MIEGISRREFIKYCGTLAAMLSLSQSFIPKIAQALEVLAAKTPLLWLQGQTCTACLLSFLNSEEPTPAALILETLSLRFQPNLVSLPGDQALAVLKETEDKLRGEFVLVVEGALPLGGKGKFVRFGLKEGKEATILDWVVEAAPKARLVIGFGTCAAYGGIPAAGPTQAKGLGKVLKNTPLVNIPGCPPHPDWLVGTLVKQELFGKERLLKGLDQRGRPQEFYGQFVHDQCPRRSFFEAGKFLKDFNNPKEEGFCLAFQGCKGPVTHADCPVRKWNGGVSFCIEVNHPCIGCTEPSFYAGLSPIYEKLPDINFFGYETKAEAIGKVLGEATAFGLGGHFIYQVATGKIPRRRLPRIKERITADKNSRKSTSKNSRKEEEWHKS